MVRLDDELTDVDVPVVLRDVSDDDVQAGAVQKGRVDERRGQIDSSSRAAEHPLHQVADLSC